MNVVERSARRDTRLVVGGERALRKLKKQGNRRYRHEAGVKTRLLANGRLDEADFTPSKFVTGHDVALPGAVALTGNRFTERSKWKRRSFT